MAVRSVMHQAGASVLTRLLRFASPTADQRIIPCGCGRQAHYHELRSKPVLTAVGKVEVSRPYYLCPHCHTGQFPADVELDIVHTEFSPGVRRMQAVVGQEAPFDHGRQQMKLAFSTEDFMYTFEFQTKKSIEELRRSPYHQQLGRNVCSAFLAQQQGIRMDTAFKKIEEPVGDLWLLMAEIICQQCLNEAFDIQRPDFRDKFGDEKIQ